MKRGLQNILRIRMLQEDLAIQVLQGQTAEFRRFEQAAGRRQEMALAIRTGALDHLRLEGGGPIEWQLDWRDAEIVADQRHKLAVLAQRSAEAASLAQQSLAERSRERRQAETLVASAQRAAETERLRREQRHLDDWFQTRSMGRRTHFH